VVSQCLIHFFVEQRQQLISKILDLWSVAIFLDYEDIRTPLKLHFLHCSIPMVPCAPAEVSRNLASSWPSKVTVLAPFFLAE
jgi:hypothetical protein